MCGICLSVPGSPHGIKLFSPASPMYLQISFFFADGKFLLSHIFIIRSSAGGHQG